MKVNELIERLKNYSPDMEVRIMNTAIDEDEACPSFELASVESASEIASEVQEIFGNPDTDCVFLEFTDDLHIMDEYNIHYNPGDFDTSTSKDQEMTIAEEDRMLEAIEVEITIQCSKCKEIECQSSSDEYHFRDWIMKLGWRATPNNIYCPQCAKKYLKK